MTKRHRSAVTGEYVTAEQAKADPERTVSESADVGRELLVLQLLEHEARIETLEVAVAELRGNQQTAGPSTEVAGGCQEQDQAEDRD